MNTSTSDDNRIGVYVNTSKFKSTQPDLTGDFYAFGKSFAVALWEQTTQTGERTYYSGSLTQKDERHPQYWKLKLYEFRKREEFDPDYRAKESIVIGERRFFIYAYWRTEGDIWCRRRRRGMTHSSGSVDLQTHFSNVTNL